MTFSYVPADRPPVWMQFVPARENTARPAEDAVITEGMVHADMTERKSAQVPEQPPVEIESSAAEAAREEVAGVHILSVDQPSQMRTSQLRMSQLAECEYQQDCVPLGKEQAMQMPVDSIFLTTTTGRGRDAAVVEMRLSADQSGSPVDCAALILDASNLPKEFCVVASLPDGKRLSEKQCRNDSLCHPKIDRLPSSQAKSGERYSCRAVGDKCLISSTKMPRLVGPVVGMKSTMISHGKSPLPSCADAGNQAPPWPCESAIYRTTAPPTIPTLTLGPKVPQFGDSGKRHFLAARCHPVMPSMTI